MRAWAAATTWARVGKGKGSFITASDAKIQFLDFKQGTAMETDAERYERNKERLFNRSLEQEAELIRIEREAIVRFSGDITELEAALGVLRIGQHFGWRVLVLIHNKRTLRKYEQILAINIREFFPAEGPSHERSVGYGWAKKIGNFWKVVSGAIKIEDRRTIADDFPKEA